MSPTPTLIATAALVLSLGACTPHKPTEATLSQALLKDKVAGGWAGKMIGVTYGAPTEFKAQGCTFDDSIVWKPSDVVGAMGQDDIYVQLTLMETMDQYGIDASAAKYHELLAKAGYMLWHANVQARKNYFDGIYPPQSGQPEYNLHADDIDFQIEADYIGFINPGMPQSAAKEALKIGHIMNYGDGVYGGVFVAALYAEAFFNNNIAEIVDKALLSIPPTSNYARIIRDVQLLHRQYPTDWRQAWQELDNKWGTVHICEAGSNFNIDAKLNGAYIVMGLLYGNGDVDQTMEIATRCGQDSDCNPSNAVAVLGIIKGLSGLPAPYRQAVQAMSDSLFVYTSYSFSKAVDRTLHYANILAQANGGRVTDTSVTIQLQEPQATPAEDAFPQVVFAYKEDVWAPTFATQGVWPTKEQPRCRYSAQAGNQITYTFEGTGVSMVGNWIKNGGKADVYVDGQLKRRIDTYFDYARQEHHHINLYHILGLPQGKHTVRLVVLPDRNPGSAGSNIEVSGAIVYQTAPKVSDSYKFSFQQ